MNKTLSGMHAGLIATGPMTLSMVVMQQMLKDKEKSPFPPATISVELLKALTREAPPDPAQTLLTSFAHLTYGAAAGGLYSHTLGNVNGVNPVAKGVAFACGFWATNYFILLPTLNVRASGFKMTPKRNLMMLASHIVWGACLGYLEDNFRKSGYQELAGIYKAPLAE